MGAGYGPRTLEGQPSGDTFTPTKTNKRNKS